MAGIKIRKSGEVGALGGKNLAKAVGMRINGASYGDIAKAFDTSRANVWNKFDRDGLRDKIEEYLKQYLELTVPASLRKSAELVNADIAGPDGVVSVDLYKMQMSEIDKVLKTAGMRPSESTPVFIQNLNQISTFENPLVKQMIESHVKGLIGNGAIDAEEVS